MPHSDLWLYLNFLCIVHAMTKKIPSITTTRLRVFIALLIGAGVGTAITTGQYLIGLYETNGPQHFQEWWASKGTSVSLFAYPIWFGFIAVFGGPIWILLHKLKLLHWLVASSAAAIISFVIMLAIATKMFTGRTGGNWTYYGRGGQQWEDGVMTAFGWKVALLNAAEYAAIGAIIGFVILSVAYRRS